MQRIVVLPIHLDELVDATWPELFHLRDEALAADGRGELLYPMSRSSTVRTACCIEARMIGPESISVPSRSKRTMRKRMLSMLVSQVTRSR